MGFIAKIILGMYLLFASLIDIRKKRLSIVYLGAGFVIIPLFIISDGVELTERLIGLIPGILLYTISIISKGVGEADIIIIILLGLSIRIGGIILVLMVSFLIIAVYSGFMLIFGRLKLKSKIPYIPFAFAGYLATCLLQL